MNYIISSKFINTTKPFFFVFVKKKNLNLYNFCISVPMQCKLPYFEKLIFIEANNTISSYFFKI